MTVLPELLIDAADVPAALQAWFTAHDTAATVTTIERLSDGRLLIRPVPGVSAELIARLRITMARYDEALRNLS
jgi:hypothetical protein